MRFFENVDLGTYVRYAADANELVVQHGWAWQTPFDSSRALCHGYCAG